MLSHCSKRASLYCLQSLRFKSKFGFPLDIPKSESFSKSFLIPSIVGNYRAEEVIKGAKDLNSTIINEIGIKRLELKNVANSITNAGACAKEALQQVSVPPLAQETSQFASDVSDYAVLRSSLAAKKVNTSFRAAVSQTKVPTISSGRRERTTALLESLSTHVRPPSASADLEATKATLRQIEELAVDAGAKLTDNVKTCVLQLRNTAVIHAQSTTEGAVALGRAGQLTGERMAESFTGVKDALLNSGAAYASLRDSLASLNKDSLSKFSPDQLEEFLNAAGKLPKDQWTAFLKFLDKLPVFLKSHVLSGAEFERLLQTLKSEERLKIFLSLPDDIKASFLAIPSRVTAVIASLPPMDPVKLSKIMRIMQLASKLLPKEYGIPLVLILTTLEAFGEDNLFDIVVEKLVDELAGLVLHGGSDDAGMVSSLMDLSTKGLECMELVEAVKDLVETFE